MNLSPRPQNEKSCPARRDGGENFIAGGGVESRHATLDSRGALGRVGLATRPKCEAESIQSRSSDRPACKNWKHGVEATSLKKATPQFASVSVPTEPGTSSASFILRSPFSAGGEAREGTTSVRESGHSRGGRNQSSMSVPAPAKRCQRDDAGHGKPNAYARGCRHRMVCEISRGGHATYFRTAQRQHRQAAQGQTEKRREASWWASELSKTVGDVAAVRPISRPVPAPGKSLSIGTGQVREGASELAEMPVTPAVGRDNLNRRIR